MKTTEEAVGHHSRSLKCQVDVWQGYWGGWQEKTCTLRNGIFTIFKDTKQTQIEALLNVVGKDLEFSFRTGDYYNEKNLSDEAVNDGFYLLSFECQESDVNVEKKSSTHKTKHHLRFATKVERDNWILHLKNSSIGKQDIMLKINLLNICREVMVSEYSKLKSNGERLIEYPEVNAILSETRIAVLTCSSMITTLYDGHSCLKEIELEFEKLLFEERRIQESLIRVMSGLHNKGFELSLTVDDSEVDLFSFPAEEERMHDNYPSRYAYSKLQRMQNLENMFVSLSLNISQCLHSFHLLVSHRLSLEEQERGNAMDDAENYVHRNPHQENHHSRQPFDTQSLRSTPVGRREPSIAASTHLSYFRQPHTQQNRTNDSPYSSMSYRMGSTSELLEKAHQEFIIFDTALKTMELEYCLTVEYFNEEIKAYQNSLLFERKKTGLMYQRLLEVTAEAEDEEENFVFNEFDNDEEDPEHLKNKYLERQFNCTAKQLFDQFFGDNPTALINLYDELGYYEVELNKWKDDQRTNFFSLDVDSPLGRQTAESTDESTLTWQKNKSGFTITSKVQAPKMPYGNTFYSNAQYHVKQISENSIRVTLSAETVWVSPPFLNKIKNMIEDLAGQQFSIYAKSWEGAVIKFEKAFNKTLQGHKNLPKDNDVEFLSVDTTDDPDRITPSDLPSRSPVETRPIRKTLPKKIQRNNSKINNNNNSNSSDDEVDWEYYLVNALAVTLGAIALISFRSALKQSN